MNDFNRCNKRSGVKWLNKPINSVIIKIQLKPQNNIALPHFEDFTENTDSQLDANIQEFSFKWQQKVFNAWQLHRYSNPHNCITDTEQNYHSIINNSDVEPSKVFTNIHDDNYLSLFENDKTNRVDSLASCLESLDVNGRLGKYLDDTVSTGRLFRSEENVASEEQQIAMHVMLDNSEYNEDHQLLSKQEAVLLTLLYNPSKRSLIITPDINNLEWSPYTVETSSGVRWNYVYAVDLLFEDGSQGGGELIALLQKLRHKWYLKHRPSLQFLTPAHGTKQYVVTLEVLSAKQFDAKDLYIEFYIKLPTGVTTKDARHGRTHTASCLTTDGDADWCYAHLIELTIEADLETDTEPIQLFFEAISTDWWARHRTEGYAHFPLTLSPGLGTRQLDCVRPEERDTVEAESRRFFVGGCNLIKDLEVLAGPKNQETNFRFVATGCITIRWQTLVQCQHSSSQLATTSHGGSATALLRGAEAVLRQYRKARARLAAATRDVQGGAGMVDR